MVESMETIGLKLSESEQQMFGQLFTYYDSDNSGIVSQSVAKQLLNSSQLEPNILDQVFPHLSPFNAIVFTNFVYFYGRR